MFVVIMLGMYRFALCEGYLGIEAHWDMWIHLFRDEFFIENVQGQPKRYARAGGLMLHLRTQRSNLYISCKMATNNAGWTRGWFYLHNNDQRLPAFTNKVLRKRPEKWNWGVSPQSSRTGSRCSPTRCSTWRRKG